MGVALLRGERAIVDGAARIEWDGRVWIAEGWKDLAAVRCNDLAVPTLGGDGTWRTFAVLGMYEGAWTGEIAARVPDGAVAVIDTDAKDKDGKGEKYARQIAPTLWGRCDVRRFRETEPTEVRAA
jgi:hypothetical protein